MRNKGLGKEALIRGNLTLKSPGETQISENKQKKSPETHCPAVRAHKPDAGPWFRWVWPPPAFPLLQLLFMPTAKLTQSLLLGLLRSCSERQPCPKGGGPLSLLLQPQPSGTWRHPPCPGPAPPALLSLLWHTVHAATGEQMHLYGIISHFPACSFFFSSFSFFRWEPYQRVESRAPRGVRAARASCVQAEVPAPTRVT